MVENNRSVHKLSSNAISRFGWDILLILVLISGALLRTVGLDWGEGNHLHPDERFVTWVTSDMRPVSGLSEYFDTAKSSLNPHNLGHGFFVYGTWPLFITRAVGDAIGQVGFGETEMVGRTISALFDTLTILLVYFLARTLLRREDAAVLSAALYAFAVLPIQSAHFYTVDSNLVFFITLGLLFAARVAVSQVKSPSSDPMDYLDGSNPSRGILHWLKRSAPGYINFIAFGIALGMAVASKVSAAPLAAVLPLAAWVKYQSIPETSRRNYIWALTGGVILAAFVSLVTFRVLNPYAFMGPGFFGLSINERWVANLREISVLSSGSADFPPALQWVNRPITFALENMVFWGLGLPLGLAAWLAFIFIAYRIFKKKELTLLIPWSWTALIFVWQSINHTRAMRYQLPIYPTLTVIAGWGLAELVRWAWRKKESAFTWQKILSIASVAIVLVGTGAWAFAFTRIYTRPITRLAASDWIYQNVPAAITVPIETANGLINQPVAYQLGDTISASAPMDMLYQPEKSAELQKVTFTYAIDATGTADIKSLFLDVVDVDSNLTIGTAFTQSDFMYRGGDPRGDKAEVFFNQALFLQAGKKYRFIARLAEPDKQINVYGPINLTLVDNGREIWDWLPEPVMAITAQKSFSTSFTAIQTGEVRQILLNRVVDRSGNPVEKELIVSLENQQGEKVQGTVRSNFSASGSDPRGAAYTIELDQPLQIEKGSTVTLAISLGSGDGQLGIHASKQVFESSWDDPLPYSRYGIDWNGYTSGAYRTDLNLELYWDDNPEKVERITRALDQADYIYISSNRQWGTTVRVPERYPLTTAYYRLLLGCPASENVLNCYRNAVPGMYSGQLGYELVQVFTSYPNLGRWEFNTQYAEEAFSVYDHPKVMIFKKTAKFDPDRVRQLLEQVDTSRIIKNPGAADNQNSSKTLLLDDQQLNVQQEGGTWSELFHPDAWYNRYPGLGVLYWYLFLTLLGWLVYPSTRIIFNGLSDYAYPASRLVGLILLAYFSWLLGSTGFSFSKGNILLVLVVIAAVNLALAYLTRQKILEDIRNKSGVFLTAELVILAFFLLDLVIRYGNGDLWHPAFGGEKPMDFSYFNAVLKSTIFPPYDPWFAGGYINYYYFGFVLVGTPVKLLGIVPSIAYNFILPTLFSLGAATVYSFANNLFQSSSVSVKKNIRALISSKSVLAGIIAALFVYLAGNQGTLKMVLDGILRLGAPGGVIEPSGLIDKFGWFIKGIGQYLSGMRLPYSTGDWYWIPSRAIPFGEITEFPFFTFLYADLHAHLIALPVTGLAFLWALSIYFKGVFPLPRFDRKTLTAVLVTIIFGGIVIGSLRPINTWDLPTYFVIASGALIWSALQSELFLGYTGWKARFLGGVMAVLLLGLFSYCTYLPYLRWYAQGYNAFDIWKGPYTPINSYLTHWGLFLFILWTWLVVESVDWMASTPASSLRRLAPYKNSLFAAAVALLLVVIVLLVIGVQIAWIVLPTGVWIVILLLRPRLENAKRAILFLAGCGLALTLIVEFVTLRGDIGRMNTVFKFYLQSWVLLGMAAAAALVWIWPKIRNSAQSRASLSLWRVVFAFLMVNAFLYPLKAGISKIQDRIAPAAPRSLDGMSYMAFAGYSENGRDFKLDEDYRAIRWMQAEIKGSPVIVEANVPEYRWGTRYTIYTGLPGVVGWNWHQRQQRSLFGVDPVSPRVEEVTRFYLSNDRMDVEAFLNKYNVRYIVLGQLELAVYPPEGLAKFDQWQGDLWKEVFRDGDTRIFEVLRR